MVDLIGTTIDDPVDAAVRNMVNAAHFRAGSLVSMPVLYPSGGTVVVEITRQRDRFFVSDRGGSHEESEQMGALTYFHREAARVSERSYIQFNGHDMFIDGVAPDQLAGAMMVVANCSQDVAAYAAHRMIERADRDGKDELYERLVSIYRTKRVEKDAERVAASNHKWKVSVVVSDDRTAAFFEPVANHYITIVGTAAKFHDFAKMENAPKRIAVIKSRESLGDYYGVISAAATSVIIETASNDAYEKILAA